MNEREIEKTEFYFTGAAWNKYDSQKEAQYKQQAANIKKKFIGADYRIVTGVSGSWLGTDSKGIWGNEVFNKVQYWKETDLEDKLNNIDAQIADLENKIAELKNLRIKRKEADEEIRKLLK